jgi:hypothetical protein
LSRWLTISLRGRCAVVGLRSRSPILRSRSTVLRRRSTILRRMSTVLRRRSTILRRRSTILRRRSTIRGLLLLLRRSGPIARLARFVKAQ